MRVRELFENVIPVDFKGKKKAEPSKERYYAQSFGKQWAVFRGNGGGDDVWVKGAKSEEEAKRIADEHNSGVVKEPKRISLMQAFGSHQINLLKDLGIHFMEKPSYWEDLDKQHTTSSAELAHAVKELAKHGYKLHTFSQEELFTGDPKGPMVKPRHIPEEKTFIVKLNNGNRYIVDRSGASSYFRMWSKIKG